MHAPLVTLTNYYAKCFEFELFSLQATIFLETLLNRYTQESTPETVYEEFVKVILEAAKAETEPAALTAMQNVLAKAVLWDKSVLDYM